MVLNPEDSLRIEEGKRALRGEAPSRAMEEELDMLFTRSFYEL